ncbi:MAG: hypothetical protein HUU41_00190 [Bryobacteraceae bacterium]|nr:hypothetical protein [Bryobacterales bacterium]MEB2363357.1 hypothetical protein [Bryobacterales bacterium]NUM99503.1 hypothetical protein [Bryobacteraceae bacterium]
MSTRNRLAAVLFAGALAAWPQSDAVDPRSTLHITLPEDSPISVVSADWGESRATARGGAMVLDLRTSLSLRNSGQAKIRGVTLLVEAQDVTPGGKASVAVPSLDAGVGDVFPVRVDMRLMRPLQSGTGPLVTIKLDGVLFDDLSFYGPNELNSRRSMRAWEMEARRDRQYFKAILESRGPEGLREAFLSSVAALSSRPRMDVRFARGGRATNFEAEHELQFAFLRFPDSPVDPISGVARASGSEIRAPRIDVKNRSKRGVSYVEIGWILKDRNGRQFLAGSVPSSDGLDLAPGQTGKILESTSLRFSSASGRIVDIQGVTGYVSQVEFDNGEIWIPSRSSLNQSGLQGVAAPSPEEQRLTNIYVKKGLEAVIQELRKF